MAERAGEKHRKKTQESKQSQDDTPEQSVQDAATSIVTTNTSYSFTGLYRTSLDSTLR